MESKPKSPFSWKQAWDFADAAKERAAKNGFAPSRAAERAYERQLKSVAEQIRGIVTTGGTPENIEKQLRSYAEILDPWARQSAANMVSAAQKKNLQTWKTAANRMGLDMRVLLNSPGVGEAVRRAIDGNVALIKSLALDSAGKVAKITREAMYSGSRAEDIAKRIEAVGEVSQSRARTIARTEVSKAGTALTQARAADVGSKGYIWRTARDGDTRPSHRAMEGVYVPWDKQPVLDNMTGHAGEFPNCRCYPEPVIPRDDDGRGGVFRPALPTQGSERNAGEKRLLSVWERQESSQVIPHEPGEPLVNVKQAYVPSEKLTTYALDRNHQRGGDKAIAFYRALGFENTPAHREKLMRQVLEQVVEKEADRIEGTRPGVGEQFRVVIPVTGPNGKTVAVKTNWIYDRGAHGYQSTMPRLTTIMVKKRKGKK